ncbi:MAG: RNA polymerase sporulation sigma factor SigH [Clostridia bacterium]|nr:RNA polymerase sporulation sigma factor SigH [Clostridia bacterium]
MTDNGSKPNYEAMSDEALSALAKHGDKDAERLLIMRFMPLVRMKARPYFLIGADNADLLQEGSIGLFGAIRDFDNGRGTSFRSFAEVCIKNSIIAAVKSSTRKKHTPMNNYISLDKPLSEEDEASATFGDMLGAAAKSPEELFISRESERRLVQKIAQKLTDFEKQVLALFLEGMSYKQIGEATGRTPKAADNALQRIKKKVLAILESEKNDEDE